MKNAVIIAAAGSGKRFGHKTPKQFLKLSGKPMLTWSVETFASIKSFKQIIVVVPEYMIESLRKRKNNLLNKVEFAPGGKERFDSIKNGLELIKDDVDFVAVHDAARPLISKRDILAVLKEAEKTKASIAVEKTKDTIKLVSAKEQILKTLDRKVLRNAQTPQIFETKLLKKAYSKRITGETTDDSQLAERLKIKVSAVETKFPNFKVTAKQDFVLAEKLLKRRKMYIGFGYDVHRFKKGRSLVLGGVKIQSPKGLDGHSDADVLLHALMDALLGAAGLNDIGHFFPNADVAYKNISSLLLLEYVYKELKKKKYKINNIDVTVVAESPKIYPFIDDMKTNISKALKFPKQRIGIKATTNEKMGFIGRGEGVAAMAAASIFGK
ncbi:MAG: 2-C-methyl-D-erythritol 4-phosphate cytidylyltransferase [Endomicrobium sp.]|jgi:2-C-methyl-D-erythritol 4-phosphate cytidylyltransferase/2-C-methyl-D-erythritol 2,4-cyclodiphosphate synthase|nr:2-C-methyl-D-erythritol 4-phosphate cytidylyltransferase [Endomicrobium sp.]